MHHFDLSEGCLFPFRLAFGNSISSLNDHIFCMGFCNIGGFLAMFALNVKAQEIKHFMVFHNVNLFGRCEANLNWSKSLDSKCLQEWFCDIPSCCTYSAHNVNEKVGLKEYSSTFWIGTALASQFIVGMNKDPTGLGCWVVCILSGHSAWKIHFVFGYQPYYNT